jgi:hypothetical protein
MHVGGALMADKAVLRMGAVSAVLGGIVTQVSGAMHPVETATIFDPVVHMREVAENPTWSAVYVGFSVGFLLLLGGLSAIARAITDEPAAAWAALAQRVATVTTAVALVFFILDGFATKTVALSVVASGNAESMVAAASVLDKIGRMFFGQWTFLSWGVTPLLFGVTLARSRTFPRLLALPPLVTGALGLGVGFLHDLRDFSLGMLPPFYAGILIFNVWMVAMGVSLWRKGSAAARVPAGLVPQAAA